MLFLSSNEKSVMGLFDSLLEGKTFSATLPRQGMSVVGTGGSSGRSTTMFGDTEWSATGLVDASLGDQAGWKETEFAYHRCLSRLVEMQSIEYEQRHRYRHHEASKPLC
ncbi:hypothetical protein SARC_14592 [Sphaeroforma arctica JP610]|uniref:Uncharacterized protein n=1 Tax=Sphaeroforma arctica JP610 TaxID=667725 RepID=A0A0L0F8H0_9EUKA|nr:hypothetical protein SARC_14592 [Sphaeroforma arctica JP610]KNC72846.1 hypothetical protein SARC_14592 [Sphaeroforma arctica JP610]|eukprot:XP_014146748.1 hypothetical protein SARC_14592 [Sphaeroforma arctica JP610]